EVVDGGAGRIRPIPARGPGRWRLMRVGDVRIPRDRHRIGGAMFGGEKKEVAGRVANLHHEVKIVNPYVRYAVLTCELQPVEGPGGAAVRVEIHGPTGPRVPGKFKGEVGEGDLLEVTGKVQKNQTLLAEKAFNQTKGCRVI